MSDMHITTKQFCIISLGIAQNDNILSIDFSKNLIGIIYYNLKKYIYVFSYCIKIKNNFLLFFIFIFIIY